MKKLNLNLICKKRKDKQITLQEMAEMMGLKNASTYMKYEKGEYSFRAEHLPVLAKTLNCEIQDLFFEDRLAKLANTQSHTA
ncbi:MAG: helix-turn-helix transcriptional regulator [Smithellaceae bacterium]|jgi:transcriptional regulator with XRE-family HTH domain|nr:helix-turn-helix transcriptional regulator [Smithellaceae bacterium]